MKKRMHVVQVPWSLLTGGSERYSVDLAESLDPQRYTTSVIAFSGGGKLEQELSDLAIPWSIAGRHSRGKMATMWGIYNLLRKTRPDVVHTHHFAPLFHSLLGAKLVGARLVHTEHKMDILATSSYKRFALRVMSWFCSATVAVGDQGADFLRDAVGVNSRKIHVIPGGVRLGGTPITKNEARRTLGLKQDELIAVMVARLRPEKNHLLLLRAFHKVSQDLPTAKLLLVGDGTEHQAIEALIVQLGLTERVALLGARTDVACILAACDVFVLSSDSEALPISVMEAMASGLPVVATDVGDMKMLVHQGVTGWLVPAGDADAIAAALVELLRDTNKASEFGLRGRELAQEFSVAAMVRKYEALYEECR